jgi:tetrahydromethanopterin S-methyltransferase subunit D
MFVAAVVANGLLFVDKVIMKTVINDIIQQNIESIHDEDFHVDETRQLISMTTEGLISVISTVVQVAADKVSDPVEREAILKICN